MQINTTNISKKTIGIAFIFNWSGRSGHQHSLQWHQLPKYESLQRGAFISYFCKTTSQYYKRIKTFSCMDRTKKWNFIEIDEAIITVTRDRFPVKRLQKLVREGNRWKYRQAWIQTSYETSGVWNVKIFQIDTILIKATGINVATKLIYDSVCLCILYLSNAFSDCCWEVL